MWRVNLFVVQDLDAVVVLFSCITLDWIITRKQHGLCFVVVVFFSSLVPLVWFLLLLIMMMIFVFFVQRVCRPETWENIHRGCRQSAIWLQVRRSNCRLTLCRGRPKMGRPPGNRQIADQTGGPPARQLSGKAALGGPLAAWQSQNTVKGVAACQTTSTSITSWRPNLPPPSDDTPTPHFSKFTPDQFHRNRFWNRFLGFKSINRFKSKLTGSIPSNNTRLIFLVSFLQF
jgi:hypothetical protein